MTVFSKQNYEDPDDGRILKASRKQQYIMFPDTISFLNDKLKAERGMRTKKEEEESDDANCCSLKVPIDHKDKEFKICMVKIKPYDSGTPEFLKWCLILNEQVKNNGYTGNYDMIMSLAQAMLAGHSLEAFLNEKRPQEANNRIRKAKTQTEHVKLLPLPQPPLRARTDARTNPSAQRATQLRSVLARIYAVARQNQITTNVP
jgi:hypothetical protein